MGERDYALEDPHRIPLVYYSSTIHFSFILAWFFCV